MPFSLPEGAPAGLNRPAPDAGAAGLPRESPSQPLANAAGTGHGSATQIARMKRKSIKTRIIASCSALTAVAAVLGLTGYVMFERVNHETSLLSRWSLPTVQHSTGVERSAFECVLKERDYVLNQKDETHRMAREKVAALMASLDQVDQVARQFKDTALAAKAKEVRRITQQWAQLYEQGVAAFQSNRLAETELAAKGQVVSAEAEAFLAAKNAEYSEGKTALALVNRISALAFETRMNEKAYMLSKERKYFEVIQTNLAWLLSAYTRLEALHPDATEQKQIADARQATQDSSQAAQKWVEVQKATMSAAAVMETNFGTVLRASFDFLLAKEKDYRTSPNEGGRTNAFQALILGRKLPEHANAAVIFSKKYMLEPTPENWRGVTNQIALLLKTCAELG